MCPTCDFSFEGTAHDVLWSSILYRDQVVPRGHWRVCDLVALRTLDTVHLHLGGPVDGDGQGAGSSIASVHDEF